MIKHSDRGTTEFEGERHADHNMTVGVHGGYGYLSYSDIDHEYAISVGDPTSPELPAHYTHYEPGAGVPLGDLRKALVEFLETARRPTCLEWRNLDAEGT